MINIGFDNISSLAREIMEVVFCCYIFNIDMSNELIWSILINNIGIDDPQPCNYSPERDGDIPESPPPLEPPPFEESYSPPSPQIILHLRLLKSLLLLCLLKIILLHKLRIHVLISGLENSLKL